MTQKNSMSARALTMEELENVYGGLRRPRTKPLNKRKKNVKYLVNF